MAFCNQFMKVFQGLGVLSQYFVYISLFFLSLYLLFLSCLFSFQFLCICTVLVLYSCSCAGFMIDTRPVRPVLLN